MVDAVKVGDPVTGPPSQVLETIRRKVSALASWNSAIYIGKTTGDDGLRQRFNAKYKGLGFDRIEPIYIRVEQRGQCR